MHAAVNIALNNTPPEWPMTCSRAMYQQWAINLRGAMHDMQWAINLRGTMHDMQWDIMTCRKPGPCMTCSETSWPAGSLDPANSGPLYNQLKILYRLTLQWAGSSVPCDYVGKCARINVIQYCTLLSKMNKSKAFNSFYPNCLNSFDGFRCPCDGWC